MRLWRSNMNEELKKLFEQLAENAPQLQQGMAKMAQGVAEKQKTTTITGKAGADAVVITINGVPEVTSVELSDTFTSYSKGEQQILIKTAIEDCFTQFKNSLSSMMTS